MALSSDIHQPFSHFGKSFHLFKSAWFHFNHTAKGMGKFIQKADKNT
jgi:hypothetical protein